MNISEIIKNYYGECYKNIDSLLEVIQYRFNDENLLLEALTHKSALPQLKKKSSSHEEPSSYERLEFLGDSVLGLILSWVLILKESSYSEGTLSKVRAALVSTKSLALLSQKIGLDTCVIMGASEIKAKGQKRESILADSFEALLGAIFLDGGYEKVKDVIARLYLPLLEVSPEKLIENDYKSRLQELTQSTHKTPPTYEVIGKEGPDHALKFEVNVSFNNMVLGQGKGESKKKASQNAAMSALTKLKDNPDLLSSKDGGLRYYD